jgi:hypothetical protein
MDIKIAQKRVNDLAATMVAKGMREPNADLTLKSNAEPYVYLRWKAGIDGRRFGNGDQYEFIRGPVAEAFDKAAAFIAKQPNAEQAKLQDFMAALGSVIDIGRQHNIEVEFLNPLVATMKTLSENVITDQRAA